MNGRGGAIVDLHPALALPSQFAMKSSSLLSAFALVSITFASPLAFAHTRLMNPAPLTQDDNAKAGPCGCFFGAGPEDPAEDGSPLACPADFPVTTLQAGTALTVTWQETVNHNGDFRVAFSPKTPDATKKADVDANILMEIPDENGTAGATISGQITVPSAPCELCILQLRQFMVGAAQPYYYSCAAVKIVADDPGSSSSSGSGGSAGGASQGGGGQGGAASTNTIPGAGAGSPASTGAGMADPQPKIDDGCNITAAGLLPGDRPALGFGSLAIMGICALTRSLVRRKRKSSRS